MAINPGHNGSATLVIDGQLVYYCEEERLSRMKYDGNPFRAMLYILENYEIDELVIGGTNPDLPKLPWTNEDPYSALARKFNPKIVVTNLANEHHLGHAAAAFYGSGFENAAAIIVDGCGNLIQSIIENQNNKIIGFETETVFKCNYPATFEAIYKNLYTVNSVNSKFSNAVFKYSDHVTIVKSYEAVSDYLGFGFIEAGKTMGLAPYGQDNSNIPYIYKDGRGNKNLLIPHYPAGSFINEEKNQYLKRNSDPKEWHKDSSKVSQISKDLAYKVQKETQEAVGNLIEQTIEITGQSNIVISGGYALNCVANYYYLERFPHINFYIDPIAHDGGTAIGLAKFVHHFRTKDNFLHPITTLYLGSTPIDLLDTNMQSIKDNFDVIDTKASDIAQLLVEKNIVALFQGGAEAGPRALGNRSIIYDPRDENGKDFVNKVKGREWFRPFAGSVMLDHADEWFDLRGLYESPYMMYAVNLQESKLGLLPAITHVDGTCRVQTVTKLQNLYWYELIEEFYKLTNCPVLFNTSFNLAGDPLVETLADAVDSVLKCDIKYLYLPDVSRLLIKK